MEPIPGCEGGPSGIRGKLSPAAEARGNWIRKVPVWNFRPWLKQEEAFEGFWPVKPVLLDAGVIVALLDRSEQHHEVCAKIIKSIEAPLLTCEAVITKSCFLLRNLPGAPAAVIENVAAGIFQVSFQLSTDTEGVKRQLRKYQDREIDLAVACLIRMADQFGTGDILTLDRDFEIYRWGKNKPFQLLPARRLRS